MTVPRDHWLELERLFNGALALDPHERTAWLSEACPDGTLRDEVKRLVAAEAGAEDRLRGVIAHAVAEADRPEARIGSYRLIRELGRGGMGSVWLAERADAEYVDQVALKLIRPDVTSHGLIRRFLAERQILANLKHPNIAHLLDGGTTEDGRPYLVMEYIEGEPIDVYCDRLELSVGERIALIRPICAALQLAHTNLIVHRDIKPGNILVSADGIPRLLDFGIAKILDPATALSGATETRTGLRLMTPTYASPEQIRGESVTTASDVYSLGVVLYELLTGRLPYRHEPDNPHALAQAILEIEPDRPSAAVATSPTATVRSINRLRRQLSGDLDNILLAALRKEPERRYASVEQFSADLRRHVEGHPVVARPDTWTYRAGKFVRRNRGAVGAGMAAFISLLLFAVSVAFQARQIADERDIANLERAKAEQVTSFLVDVFAASAPNNARGMDVTAREILAEGGREVYTELAGQPEIQAAAMEAIGKVYRELGQYDSATAFLEGARDRRLATIGPNSAGYAQSLTELGYLARILAHYDSAEAYHTRAIEIRRGLGGGRTLEVAKSLNSLGVVLQDSEQFERAESLYVAAIDAFDELGARETPDAATAMNNLGDLYHTMGRYDDAIPLLQQTLALRRRLRGNDHLDVAYSLNNLASAYESNGQYDEARPLYDESLAIRRKLLPPDHGSVMIVVNNMAGLRLRTGDYAGAAEMYEEVVRTRREHPAGDMALAVPLSNLSLALVRLGRLEEALEAAEEATTLVRRAVGPRSVNATFAMHTTATVLERMGRHEESLRVRREIVDIRREAYDERGHPNLVFSLDELAWFLVDLHRPAEGMRLADEAVALGRQLFSDAHQYMADALLTAGRARFDLDRFEDAVPLLRESLDQLGRTGGSQPSTAQAQSLLGRALFETGDGAEAVPLLEAALAYFGENEPEDSAWRVATREAFDRATSP